MIGFTKFLQNGRGSPAVDASTITVNGVALTTVLNNLVSIDDVYPVGSYYWSSQPTNPANLFGGSWDRVKDKFIYALGDSGTAGDTGGSETVTLTKAQLPNISGSFIMHGGGSSTPVSAVYGDFSTDYNNTKYKDGGTEHTGANSVGNVKLDVGQGQSHDNMPPYEKAYCWKRTA